MRIIFLILVISFVSSYSQRNVTIKIRDHLAIQKANEDTAGMFIVKKKALTKNNLKVRFEHVYHLTLEDIKTLN